MLTFGDPSLPDRFWEKISPIPFPTFGTDGCWVWTGATTSKGYGSFLISARKTDAPQVTGVTHKMTYEKAFGEIEPDEEVRVVVDHLCRNRACCNPNHLEAVKEPINVARGISPSARNRQKTTCPKGHPYDDSNTIIYRKKRYCKACKRKKKG